MKYLIVRHAEADALFWNLTPKWEKGAQAFSKRISEIMWGSLGSSNTVIYTSDVLRSKITWDIIRQHLWLPEGSVIEDSNVYGGTVEKVQAAVGAILKTTSPVENIIVVTHDAGAPFIVEKLGGPRTPQKVWDNLSFEFFEV